MGAIKQVVNAVEELLPAAKATAKAVEPATDVLVEGFRRQSFKTDLQAIQAEYDATRRGTTINLNTGIPPAQKFHVRTLNQAKKMQEQGVEPDEVFKRTRWFQGEQDGVWRSQLSSENARVRDDNLQKIGKEKIGMFPEGEIRPATVTLEDVIDYPEYFELYPQMAEYPITVSMVKNADGSFALAHDSNKVLASFNPITRKFSLNVRNPVNGVGPTPKGSIMHEMSHAMQVEAGVTSGTSAQGMSSSAMSYRVSSLMIDAVKNPETLMDLKHEDLMFAFRNVGADEDEAKILVSQLERVLRGGDEAFEKEFLDGHLQLRDRAGRETAKWMIEMNNGVSKENFAKIIEEMSTHEIDDLASLRYNLDLGEMEARFADAMRDVPQNALDKMSYNPHQLMQHMDGEGLKRLRQAVPEVKRMEFSAPVEEAFISPPEKTVSQILDGTRNQQLPRHLDMEQGVHTVSVPIDGGRTGNAKVNILKNPTERQIRKFQKQFDSHAFRTIRTEDGDLFVWDGASSALHAEMTRYLGRPGTQSIDFSDRATVQDVIDMMAGGWWGNNF